MEQDATLPYSNMDWSNFNSLMSAMSLVDESIVVQISENQYMLNQIFLQKNSKSTSTLPYLTQFELFSVHPHLRKSLNLSTFWPFPRICWPYAWIGPAGNLFFFLARNLQGTITGLHKDHFDNILVQLKGRKEVLLFHPSNQGMYPTDKYDMGTTLSAVDLRDPDFSQKFPKAVELQGYYAQLDLGIPFLFSFSYSFFFF